MMDVTQLTACGIDYQKGIARCMGDEAFYEKMLRMFLADTSFQRAESALIGQDYRGLFSCMHELKGVSGNTDLTSLYLAVCPLVELLRHDQGSKEEIDPLFYHIKQTYQETRIAIEKALSLSF